ncbi:MAG: MmgE/PrpD family protein [Phycisphaerae bacterium]
MREYGWHHATLSGFAAGLAAGRVLGLTPEQLVNAIGICASRTGTLGAVTAGNLTMMKNTVDPWAARMGVESALLAARGYTGPAHIIDGKEGLFHVFGHAVARGSQCSFDADGLTRDLPSRAADAWGIERCSMKSFPVEALMHSPLSAIRQIRAARDFAASDIREIRVEVIARAADILGDPAKYRPTTRETADHSLPYSIAALLADGVLGPAQFDEQRVRDPRLVPLMDSVKVVANEAFEARFPASQPSRVSITLRDGSQHEAEVDYPKGDPRNPLTWDEIDTKFRSLAPGVIDDDTVDSVRDRVRRLDAISTRQLCEALTSHAVTAH